MPDHPMQGAIVFSHLKKFLVAALACAALGASPAMAQDIQAQSAAKLNLKIHTVAAQQSYSYTQHTFKCSVSTVYGTYSTAVTWHWSWYVWGGYIKNAWRETVAPSPPPTGWWIYNRSWEGAVDGGLGGTSIFYGMTLISHFYFVSSAGGVTQQKNAYLSNGDGMYAGGYTQSCKHT